MYYNKQNFCKATFLDIFYLSISKNKHENYFQTLNAIYLEITVECLEFISLML